MMKKALFMLAMLTYIFASCSDGGSDEPSNPTQKPEEAKSEITLDNGIVANGLSFGVAQGEQSVSFTTNTNWTLSIAATTGGSTWCKASATSGNKGTANVKFTVTENTDYDDRSVSVTIKAGTASKTFTITQKGADALLVTTKKYEVAQAGGKIEMEVKANIEYQLAVSETAKDWIKETQSKSRALTTKKHTFQIAENEEVEKREGEITIKSGDKVETVKVYQAGGAVLLLSKNEFTVSDAGETITVDIKSNVEYGVQMPDVDWIKDEASNRGMSSHTLKYVISPNEGYDSRSAEIIFYDQNSDLKDTLKVVQAQKDAIVISKKEYEVEAEGETIEVKLSANVDFEVTMPEVDWIEQVSSRAFKEHTLYIKVAKHEGEESRSAEIVFMNKDSQLSDSITIIQNPPRQAGYADGTVTIAKAGTMEKLLGDDYLSITSLKVVGPINGSDIYDLRQMMRAEGFSSADCGKLTELDLSEASIVKGGEYIHTPPYVLNPYDSQDNVIGFDMFKGCRNLEKIILPDNIINIDKNAFYNCTALESVIIGNGVTSIGNYAFYNCSSLKSITIPDNVTSIGQFAFVDCSSLESVTINGVDLELPDRLFEGCTFLKSAIIGDGVTSIGRVFAGRPALKSITIGNGVTSIDKLAFYNCSALESVIIGNGVTSIGSEAFSGCSALESVIIGNGVTIGTSTFAGCSALESITIGNGVTSIEDKAFANCSALESVIIGNGLTSIGTDAFAGCSALESITIPNGTTSIGDRTFYNCTALESIAIPETITSIGSYAFTNCKALKSIAIPNGTTSIGTAAFYGCTALESIAIPETITSIDSYAFYSCKALKSIAIPNGTTSIGDHTFYGCTALESITIPNGTTSIGTSAFNQCSALTSVTIPYGVKSIGKEAFQDCDALTSVTIPDKVSYINEGAFRDCDALASVTIGKYVNRIDAYAFINCGALTTVKIGGFTTIGKFAFQSCDALTEFYCYATKPPYIPKADNSGRAFSSKIKETAKLYVPAGYRAEYNKSDGWKQYFTNIIEMEE